MFGFVRTSPSALSDEEASRYRELYCGLCRTLKRRYGQVSRLCLTYDLTFYVILCNSLHEPPERRGSKLCIARPGQRIPHVCTSFTDYAADLSVALAYHKLLDDLRDGGDVRPKAGCALLKGAYEKARQRIPEQCLDIETCMGRVAVLEGGPNPQPDAVANEFGDLLGRLLAHGQGTWKDDVGEFGAQLGRFVYFMDAAVDYVDDEKSGGYNPFVRLNASPESMKELLSTLMGNATASFEKLPLEKDLHLMRSVLYSGVWQKFNECYGKKG